MSVVAVASTAIDIGKALSGVIGKIFGNNRDEKRKARAELQKALWAAGVNPDIYSQVHSDNWKQLRQIAEFLNREGQLGLMYINDEGTKSLGSRMPAPNPSADQVIRAFASWKASSPIAESYRQSQNQDAAGPGRVDNGSGINQSPAMAISSTGIPTWVFGIAAGLLAFTLIPFIIGK